MPVWDMPSLHHANQLILIYAHPVHLRQNVFLCIPCGKHSDRCQRLIQISQQVFHILNAHRNANHAIRKPDFSSSLFP